MSSKIEIRPGDLLVSGAPIIAHQVNCMGAMGAGVAKAIKVKYFGVYDIYRRRCAKDGITLRLLCDFAEKKGIPRIAMPYRIGCGLAGGDWRIVEKIISSEFERFTGTVELWDINRPAD